MLARTKRFQDKLEGHTVLKDATTARTPRIARKRQKNNFATKSFLARNVLCFFGRSSSFCSICVSHGSQQEMGSRGQFTTRSSVAHHHSGTAPTFHEMATEGEAQSISRHLRRPILQHHHVRRRSSKQPRRAKFHTFRRQ